MCSKPSIPINYNMNHFVTLNNSLLSYRTVFATSVHQNSVSTFQHENYFLQYELFVNIFHDVRYFRCLFCKEILYVVLYVHLNTDSIVLLILQSSFILHCYYYAGKQVVTCLLTQLYDTHLPLTRIFMTKGNADQNNFQTLYYIVMTSYPFLFITNSSSYWLKLYE